MSSGSTGGSAIGSEDVTADGKRSLPKGAHVRFSTVEVDGAVAEGNLNDAINKKLDLYLKLNLIYRIYGKNTVIEFLFSGHVSSTANQTSTANITSTINGAIITCSSITGTTCHMTAASATWSQTNSTHGVEHATAATCITTTAATILESRGSSDDRGGAQRLTGKSTTSQKAPGGKNIFE